MTITDFILELQRVAPKGWTLTRDGKVRRPSLIVPTASCCPITAVYEAEENKHIPLSGLAKAADTLGLSALQAAQIGEAADGEPGTMRDALLAAVGLS